MVVKKKAKVSKPKLTEITIWTRRYRPFIMGGDCYRPMKTRVMATGPYPIGKGFKAYVVYTPPSMGGGTIIAEAKSGGIVGDTLDDVIIDVRGCPNKAFMTAQVNESILSCQEAELLSLDEFWEQYGGRKLNGN